MDSVELIEEYRRANQLILSGDIEGISVLNSLCYRSYPPALFALGWRYLNGAMVEKSGQSAVKFLMRAESKGHVAAGLFLAMIEFRYTTFLRRAHLIPTLSRLFTINMVLVMRDPDNFAVLGIDEYLDDQCARDSRFASLWVVCRGKRQAKVL